MKCPPSPRNHVSSLLRTAMSLGPSETRQDSRRVDTLGVFWTVEVTFLTDSESKYGIALHLDLFRLDVTPEHCMHYVMIPLNRTSAP